MRLSSLTLVVLMSLCAAGSSACRREVESPANAVAMLQSPDPDERREAATDLMRNEGPPLDTVPYLIMALQREQNPKTYGVILLALGKSGAPEAVPYIDANLQNPNKSVREKAEKASDMWAKKNRYSPVPPQGQPYPPPPGAPQGPPPDAPPEPQQPAEPNPQSI